MPRVAGEPGWIPACSGHRAGAPRGARRGGVCPDPRLPARLLAGLWTPLPAQACGDRGAGTRGPHFPDGGARPRAPGLRGSAWALLARGLRGHSDLRRAAGHRRGTGLVPAFAPPPRSPWDRAPRPQLPLTPCAPGLSAGPGAGGRAAVGEGPGRGCPGHGGTCGGGCRGRTVGAAWALGLAVPPTPTWQPRACSSPAGGQPAVTHGASLRVPPRPSGHGGRSAKRVGAGQGPAVPRGAGTELGPLGRGSLESGP